MARILIAEDDADLRLLLRLVLHRAGHSVVEAPDGVQALDVLTRERIDLALLDNAMPHMTGVEVLQACERLTSWHRPLLVVISALATRTDIRSYYLHGADDFIAKPFTSDEVVDRVGMLLDERAILQG